MKIDVRYNDLKTTFGDLATRDTFVDCGTVYMKICEVKVLTGDSYNAVRLATGGMKLFSDKDPVINVRVVAHTEIIE